MKNAFSDQLISWFSNIKRDLPWRSTQDPYKIWLSEIILQQTRVDQGLPYYNSFVIRFPTIFDLANAREQDVLKQWEGLGYYSRARNLHETAKIIAHDRNGVFPDTYAGLIRLKGIGPYTAAAIASIAFNEPKPVVDGNVFRFISRYFGVLEDIMKPASRKIFENLLDGLIDHTQPGAFNQAVMEYGAVVCKPVPACGECYLKSSCYSYQNQAQSSLPTKSKSKPVTEIFMSYLILEHEGQILMKRRDTTIWQGLFEFLLIESTQPQQPNVKEILGSDSYVLTKKSEAIRHLLSHRRLWITFYHLTIQHTSDFQQIAKEQNLTSFATEEILNLPKPKIIVDYLRKTVI